MSDRHAPPPAPRPAWRRQVRDGLVRAVFRPPLVAPRPVQRILVIRPDQVGDLLFATPALARLREAFPAAAITGLVGPWGRVAWERQPMLDAVRVCEFPGIVQRPARPWQPYLYLRGVAARLRPAAFDLALVLRFDYWWGALLAEQAGIPARWGYGLPEMRPYLTGAEPYWPHRHEVEQDLILVEAVIAAAAAGSVPVLDGQLGPPDPWSVDRAQGLPPLSFPIHEAERTWARRLVPPGSPPAVAIQPGSNASVKLWTLDGWAAVAAWLLDHGYAVFFTGTTGEQPLIEAIRARLTPAQQAQAPSLAGQTSLGQLAALFAALRLVLGVDNGPLHLATAAGTPTVRLYGPSDERLWGPWGPAAQHRAVRAAGTAPSGDLQPGRPGLEGGPELLAITPDQVLAAVDQVLSETP